nr:immunoglobulin heavy chain junction region [Macaca mulatta]MOX59131.1 immunoglobulin heavy chain junction region [Macaca mulatta]MOX59237.1 immunoglobulin heavy chain junction region [Macaca mulatta]MOX59838.1 immunoglobulin heavy chain junction region [Macaca mulatta]MOX59932.1 immunoglobulin heavy chain junction region [Macaca mulatta]
CARDAGVGATILYYYDYW